MMTSIRVHLFGQLRVEVNGHDVTIEARKARELFGYLLLHQQRPHTRDELANQLWGGQDACQERAYFRKTLWQLRSAFECQSGGATPEVVQADHHWVRLGPSASIWSDLNEFEQAFNHCRNLSGQHFDDMTASQTRQAVALYQGEVLEGWYPEWCLCERERYQHMYLVMLEKLIDHSEQQHDLEMAIAFAQRLLQFDTTREETHRTLMRLYNRSGDRGAALRQYGQCAQALERDLGAKPGVMTQALFQELSGLQSPLTGSSSPDAEPEVACQGIEDMLDRLASLSGALGTLQRQIMAEVQAIKERIGKSSAP
jgi:DNA-binding SARP family transcriptional activator